MSHYQRSLVLGHAPAEIDLLGASGVRYHVELTVQRTSDERFVIAGSVHDNNSQNFTLLEERLEFDARDDS